MSVERVNPPGLSPAKGFSHAVRARGHTVYLAGQTALDADGAVVGDDVVAQFDQAMSNLLTALRAAGGEPQDLAALTIYAVDIADYRDHTPAIGQVWQRLLGRHYPATAAVEVPRLWDSAALLELQAVAVVE